MENYLVSQNDKIELSVVIPCYNESKRIEKTFNELMKFFFKHKNKFTYEIIFVSDGSSDNTYELLKSFREYYESFIHKIIIISYSDNKGKGYAVRKGLVVAKYKNVLILDADLSVHPKYLLNHAEWHDLNDSSKFMILGQREQVIKQPFYRILAGFGFRWLVKGLFLLPIDDSQCPYKLLHNIPKDLLRNLKIDGFSYDVELIYKVKKQRIHLYPTKVFYFNNEDSKVTLKKTIKMFFDLLKIRFS